MSKFPVADKLPLALTWVEAVTGPVNFIIFVSPSPPTVKETPSIVIAPTASTSTVLDGVNENVVIPVSDNAPAPSNSQVPVSSPKDYK